MGNPFAKETVADRPRGALVTGAAATGVRRGGLRYKRVRKQVSITPAYVKGLQLRERDLCILQYLGEIGFATTDQLRRLFFPDVGYVWATKQLTRLWQQHVLDRQPGDGLEKYGLPLQLVYSVGRAGALALKDLDEDEKRSRRMRGRALLVHNALLGEYLAGLAQAQGWQIRFYGERGTQIQFQWNDRRVRLRPDGLVYLSYPLEGIERAVFVELDTSMREMDSYRRKMFQYQLYLESKAWQSAYARFPYVAVIVWTSDARGVDEDAQARRAQLAERRVERIIEQTREKKLKNKLGATWLFAHLDQAIADDWRVLDQNGEVRQVHLLSVPAQGKTGERA